MKEEESIGIIASKLETYVPRQKSIQAIRYNDTEEQDIAIEDMCRISWIEYDEAGNSCGLFSPDSTMDSNQVSMVKVWEGDYLVWDIDIFRVVRKEYFEKTYLPEHCK